MPTVGIMSMQRIFNYGSTLQGHALRRLIEDVVPGAGVTFLDYEPGQPLIGAEDHAGTGGRLRRTAQKLREYNDVETSLANRLRFFNHKRTYASKYFPLVDIPLEPRRGLGVDVQVIGSDEVFNCVQDNVNVGYARDLFGHGSPAARVISYAGSFGNTTIEKIEAAGIRDELAADFREFSAVSVRDRNSADVVEALTGSRPEIHLDPTLVHDLMGRESRVPTTRQHAAPYLIAYGYSGRLNAEENRAIREYADREHLEVLAFGGLQACADTFVDCDPFTLLAYFRDAAAVVTDTFHGSIFSIINDVPFATIIRESSSHGYGNKEKLGYLLERLGLSDRAWDGSRDLGGVITAPVDWQSVRETRHRENQRSVVYLKKNIF